jgi:hypothetical protein
MTDDDKPKRHAFDLRPWTTREERRTLDAAALRRLRAERRAAVRDERAKRQDEERARVRRAPLLLRMLQRLGMLVDTAALDLRILRAYLDLMGHEEPADRVACLLHVADTYDAACDTDEDVDQHAAEIRDILIDDIDGWLRWSAVGEGVVGLLRMIGIPNAERASGLVNALEALDGPFFDALIGKALEDYIRGVLDESTTFNGRHHRLPEEQIAAEFFGRFGTRFNEGEPLAADQSSD